MWKEENKKEEKNRGVDKKKQIKWWKSLSCYPSYQNLKYKRVVRN